MCDMHDVRDETISQERGLYGVEDLAEMGSRESMMVEQPSTTTGRVSTAHAPPPLPLRRLSTPPPTVSNIALEIQQRRLSSLPPAWRQLRTPPPDEGGEYPLSESPGSSPPDATSLQTPIETIGPHSILGKHPRSPTPLLDTASFEQQAGSSILTYPPISEPPLWAPSLHPTHPSAEIWTTAREFALAQLTPRCIPDLQFSLRSRHLPSSGLRGDLIMRLADDLANEWTHCQQPLEMAPGEMAWLSARRVPELKEMCRLRGLPVGGLKRDLMVRLAEALRGGEEERRGGTALPKGGW